MSYRRNWFCGSAAHAVSRRSFLGSAMAGAAALTTADMTCRISSEFLRDADDSLVGKLKTIEDSRAMIDTAVWNMLTRPVSEDELQLFSKFLEPYRDNRLVASQQLIWALLTTSEVRFNY